MCPGLTGLPVVEDVGDGAGDGVEVPQVDPRLADHGVQVVVDGEPVVGDGGGGLGHDAHDGPAGAVERRRRGEGGVRPGHRGHGVAGVGGGRAGDVGDRLVGRRV